MNDAIAHRIKLLLITLAATMVICPALFKSSGASFGLGRADRTASFASESKILFRRGVLDTDARADLDSSAEDLRVIHINSTASSAKRLTRVVQFAGPIKREWFGALTATGAKVVGYVANNAYIVRGTAAEIARVAALDRAAGSAGDLPIRWMGNFRAIDKIDPAFSDEMLVAEPARVNVEIELTESDESSDVVYAINLAASNVNRGPRRFLNFLVLSVSIDSSLLQKIASLDEVLYIGPLFRPTLHDERSAQIVAGNLIAEGTQPSGPGYMAWLASKGLDAPPDFAIDFTDTGLDRGSTSAGQLHPDFLDNLLRSRVTYTMNYATDGFSDDRPGHGTIVASAACGRGSSDRDDEPGYMYGLGVDPLAKIGASRIFDQRGGLPFRLSFTDVASAAYSAGARISNDSWGNTSNSYDVAAQEFDSLVRDAQPSVAGNQEMTFVFSAGNGGAGGHVSSPAIAKNVISVAGSESYRPEGVDSCNLDGAGGLGPDSADNALDILRYSSGGPTADGRAKPDITAPGTHIYGAASQSPGFFGEGICPGVPVYQPPGQSLYTWSSGTSLAAPHISGAASLVRRFFVARSLLGNNRAPSPAMTKAFLLNSASYMTGANAGGDLPADRQGWGLVDLSRAFDETKRVLIDQTKLFTESGQTFEVHGSLADRSRPLRVTLAWTDAPGALVGPAIVNDLDVEVSIGGVTIYRGNNFAGAYSVSDGEPDRFNNVESVYLPPEAIPAGSQGNFTITVRAANIAGDGVPGNQTTLDQDFALVIYNVTDSIIDPPPPPPNKIPIITGATYAKKRLTITGRDFTAAAKVEINGKLIDQSFEFDPTTNSVGLKLKARKLNLNIDADNQIVLIENGERSVPFTLKL